MCELLMARQQQDESMQVNWLRKIKDSISNEAFRFSGYAQQVNSVPSLFFIF